MKNVLLLMLTMVAMNLNGADVTGTWTGSLIVPSGLEVPAYLVLKQNGTRLTGTAGPSANEQQEIVNGNAEDGNLSFEVTSGGTLLKMVLRQDNDDMEGTVTSQAANGRIKLKRGSPTAASVAASPSLSAAAKADTMQRSVQGVWRVVEERNLWRTIDKPNPGYIIYTAKHFAVVREAQDIDRPVVTDFEKATPEQLVAMWGPFVAQFGTYEITDDVLTLTILVAKNKDKTAEKAVIRFKVDGNTMTTQPLGGKPISLKLVRVE